jgi:hypothetical protein
MNQTLEDLKIASLSTMNYEPSGGRLSLPHIEGCGLPAAFCEDVHINLDFKF